MKTDWVIETHTLHGDNDEQNIYNTCIPTPESLSVVRNYWARENRGSGRWGHCWEPLFPDSICKFWRKLGGHATFQTAGSRLVQRHTSKSPTESCEMEQWFTALAGPTWVCLRWFPSFRFTTSFLTPVPGITFLSKSPARRPSSQFLLQDHGDEGSKRTRK